MAKVGAQRAAELTGRSKSTIQRAMNSGKLSYQNDNNGRRIVDVAELDRVFGIQNQQEEQNSVEAEHGYEQKLELETLKIRAKALEEKVALYEEQLTDMRGQRDHWQKQASQILITSSFAQQQYNDLRDKVKERERRVQERKQQKQEHQSNENKASASGSKAQVVNGQDVDSFDAHAGVFDFQGLWRKVKENF